MDAETGRIEAVELTTKDADDASRVGPLLDQVEGMVASFTGDGAYDRGDVYGTVAERHPEAAVVPRAPARCRAGRPRLRRRRARPAPPVHRREGPHGLAEGVRLQPPCFGGDGS